LFLFGKLWNSWQGNEYVTFEVFSLKTLRSKFSIHNLISLFSMKTETEQLPKRRNINIENFAMDSGRILTAMRGLKYCSVSEGPRTSGILRIVGCLVNTDGM
jgi:hypothetical protein